MYVSSDAKIISVINKIAPEHLELNIKNYNLLVAVIAINKLYFLIFTYKHFCKKNKK